MISKWYLFFFQASGAAGPAGCNTSISLLPRPVWLMVHVHPLKVRQTLCDTADPPEMAHVNLVVTHFDVPERGKAWNMHQAPAFISWSAPQAWQVAHKQLAK